MGHLENSYFTAEDFYNTPENERLELIDGAFFNMAPPSLRHQRLSMDLSTRINHHIKKKGGSCQVFAAPFGVQPDKDDDATVVEPDISVICDKSKLTDRGCVGAPDWIIEIVSPSSTQRDYIKKLKIYRNAGVREYWIVDPGSESVSVYNFEKDQLMPEEYTFDDTVKAGIYDDLSIDFTEYKESER